MLYNPHRFLLGMRHSQEKVTAKQCSKCNCNGHSKEECWGVCKWCKKSNHPSDICYSKPKDEETVEKVNKTHKKKNKKKKKAAKKAAMPALAEEEETDDDDSDSEEPSPVKQQVRTVDRADLAGGGAIPKRSLADRINEMNPAEREDFQK